MSSATESKAPRQAKARKQRQEEPLRVGYRDGILGIAKGGNLSHYRVEEMESKWGRAFCLTKFLVDGQPVEAEPYIVHFERTGDETCECRGHLRHNHCKHRDALRALLAADLI